MHDESSTDNYKERFKEEYFFVLNKYNKLKLTINRYYMDQLDFEPDTPIRILESQLHTMHSYLEILRDRSRYEDIDLHS